VKQGEGEFAEVPTIEKEFHLCLSFGVFLVEEQRALQQF
jgi:hypothetical protein